MNNVRDWTQDEHDHVMTIEEWEECVRDGLFIDYDGYGRFCDTFTKTELFGFRVYPSLLSTPEYERLKLQWTHINWFNR